MLPYHLCVVPNSKSLTSLLAGAGASMVALTMCSLIVMMGSEGVSSDLLVRRVLPLVASSGLATLFVLSLLHSDLRTLYEKMADGIAHAEGELRTDQLTTGRNRKSFLESLSLLLSSPSNRGCLVFVDLDHFKTVNDSLGHEAGDEVLKQAHARICAIIGKGNVFRLSGDEFAILLEDTCLTETQSACMEICQRVGEPYRVGERACSIGCSCGIVEIDAASGVSSSDLLRRADAAMYKAKQSSSGVEIFDKPMLDRLVRRAMLADRLRESLRGGAGLGTHFQVIVSRDLQPVALEALFRWNDRTLGPIVADEAISIAKEFRLLNHLSLNVLDEVCRAASSLPRLKINMNLEAAQLFDTQFVSNLEDRLATFGVASDRVILEIGEADMVQNISKISSVLRGLRDSKFILAVDNFGTSSASLMMLADLGVAHLKFDRSLLKNSREVGSIAVIHAKAQLAQSLGMSVTCEGISDAEDEAIARQSGCDYLQGFRYGTPHSLSSFLAGDLAIYSKREKGASLGRVEPKSAAR